MALVIEGRLFYLAFLTQHSNFGNFVQLRKLRRKRMSSLSVQRVEQLFPLSRFTCQPPDFSGIINRQCVSIRLILALPDGGLYRSSFCNTVTLCYRISSTSAEMSVVSARKTRLQQWADEGRPGIPTYSSWLNQVERFFSLTTDKAIRRGSFKSVRELTRGIDHFVSSHNQSSEPFVWTATADSILVKLQRLCARISGTGH